MARYTFNGGKGDISDDDVEFTAGERDSGSPYQTRESLSGVTRDCSKEMFAPDLNDIKRLLVDLLKENKAL
jgi:hypothetical protein